MTEKEKFIRETKTLIESIELDCRDLASRPLTQEDRRGIKQHLKWCFDELKKLHDEF